MREEKTMYDHCNYCLKGLLKIRKRLDAVFYDDKNSEAVKMLAAQTIDQISELLGKELDQIEKREDKL